MDKSGENYCGGEYHVVCPLCQQLSLQCPVIRKVIDVNGDMSDIYRDNISYAIILTVSKISEYREENIDK